MPDLNDYHAYKSTGGGDGGGGGGCSGGDFGCGWVVIVIVIILVVISLIKGESFEVIEGFLVFGILAFLFARSLFR